MFRENTQIGPYTLIRRLGRGGFGEVWLAERRAKFVTTKVAVKLPLQEQVDPETIRQEATLWEQASGHPNVLPIIDADEYDGQIVIVSEYAPDGSLEESLKANGPMPVREAIYKMIDILSGLQFLHRRHIIHRDLKPANILLQGDTPRLTDFGISRAIRTTVSSQSQNVSGTFAYMAPEAFDGKRSVQTDVWSAGVNLYRFLTGNYPFPHKEPTALIASIMMNPPAPLPDEIPEDIKQVIAKALAKIPDNRYRSAAEMREDLLHIAVERFDRRSVRRDLPAAVFEDVSDETVLRKPVETERDVFTLPKEKSSIGKFIFAILGTLAILGVIFAITQNPGPLQPAANLPAVDQPAGQPLIAPVTNSSPAVPHNATSVTAGNEPERNDGRNQSTPLGTVPEKSAITDPVIIGNKVYQAVNKTRENAAIAANAQSADPAAQSNARITVGEPTSVNSASTRLGEPSVFSHTPNPQRRAANRTVNAGKKP